MVICTARIASAGFSGRIETTSGPLNTPAGTLWMLVRYIGTLRAAGDVADRDAVLDQRLLEGERAADGEAHEVVAPEIADVGGFVDQFAVAPDAVAGQVGADVEVGAEGREARDRPLRRPPAPGRVSGWPGRSAGNHAPAPLAG